jgi:hypothetical protein
MASADATTRAEPEGPLSNPWPWMLSGVGATAVAFLWVSTFKDSLMPLRVLLVFAGVVATGAAIAIKPQPQIILGGALAAFFGALALYTGEGRASQWDSVRLVLWVAAPVALLAAGIAALPRILRRVVVSLIIVVHFLGICTAVTAAPPAPWLANVVWTYVYRPYLEFMYLNNAYHFYAPEPGPAYLLWFRIEYTKGDDRTYWHWEKVPNLSDDGWPQYPLALQYQRRLALAEQASRTVQVDARNMGEPVQKRVFANSARLEANQPVIPFNPGTPPDQQYQPPDLRSRRLVEAYVRHVAYCFQEQNPEVHITGIKLYRVVHVFQGAPQLELGIDPNDPTTYLFYYWGEYDTKGQLKKTDDPFLYWLMPVLPVHKDVDPMNLGRGFVEDPVVNKALYNGQRKNWDKDRKILVYVFLHAGDTKWIRYPGKKEYEEYRPSR